MAPPKKRTIHLELVGVDDRQAAQIVNTIDALASAAAGDSYLLTSNVAPAELEALTFFGDPGRSKPRPARPATKRATSPSKRAAASKTAAAAPSRRVTTASAARPAVSTVAPAARRRAAKKPAK